MKSKLAALTLRFFIFPFSFTQFERLFREQMPAAAGNVHHALL
jgi:hypothetical protein